MQFGIVDLYRELVLTVLKEINTLKTVFIVHSASDPKPGNVIEAFSPSCNFRVQYTQLQCFLLFRLFLKIFGIVKILLLKSCLLI